MVLWLQGLNFRRDFMSVRRAIGAGMVLAVLAAFFVMTRMERTMHTMTIGQAAEMADYTPFPEDIAAIEAAWDAPIPANLELVGGPDEIGFAKVWLEDGAQPIVFRGHFVNKHVRYAGLLRYVHPKGASLPDLGKGGYVIASIDDARLLIGQDTNTHPRDWFYLEPLAPLEVERSLPRTD